MNNVKILEDKIVLAAQKYYEGNPFISDAAFDNLVEKLREIEPNNPVLTTVGWGYKPYYDDLITIEHPVKIVRGLDKIQVSSESEMKRNGSYTPKYDGGSVTLYYRDYKLYKAITRGDGITGTDVTEKLKWVVPTTIYKENAVISGEWEISKEDFAKFYPNEISPRNIAIGMLLRKSIKTSEVKRFSFIAYREMTIKYSNDFDSLSVREKLADYGFVTCPVISNSEFKTYNDFFQYFNNYVHSNGKTYLLDGIVYESGVRNDNGIINYLDDVAYKTNTGFAETKVTSISCQRTRTGRYVPVANLAPVELSGAIVRRATVHNYKMLIDLQIGTGSIVRITRSGEIIPKIVEIVEPYHGDIISTLPEVCTDCGYGLTFRGVDIVCPNVDCSRKGYENLLHYVRTMGNIKGAANKIFRGMINSGNWEDISDIYTNPWMEGFKKLEGIGSSSISLSKEVYNKMTVEPISFTLWLCALNISGLGSSTAKAIREPLFKFLKDKNDNWKFPNISGIGPSIKDILNDNKEVIIQLFDLVDSHNGFKPLPIIGIDLASGNNMTRIGDETIVNDKMRVCITGALPSGLIKSEFYNEHKDKIVESDVKSCDILISNKPGSSKHILGLKLNKKILSETEFINYLKEGTNYA